MKKHILLIILFCIASISFSITNGDFSDGENGWTYEGEKSYIYFDEEEENVYIFVQSSIDSYILLYQTETAYTSTDQTYEMEFDLDFGLVGYGTVKYGWVNSSGSGTLHSATSSGTYSAVAEDPEHNIVMIKSSNSSFGASYYIDNVITTNLTPSINDALFVSQSVPTTMNVGETYSISVTMQNNGTTDWAQNSTNPYRLGDDSWTWGLGRVDLLSEEIISPDQSKTFTFNIVAPSQAGQYEMQWKMVQDGVEWFGETTDKSYINVVDTNFNDAQFVSQSVPSIMNAGKSYQISITMKNNGTNNWIQNSANPYRLGDDSWTWGLGRAELSFGETIAPTQSKTFTFNITAPSQAGIYQMQWQMVQDGVEWFGDKSVKLYINVVDYNDAMFISQSVPTTMSVGETYSISITMQNNGTSNWVQNTSNPYRLGDDSWTWGLGRVDLSLGETISPDQSKTFTFNITAPSQPGQYEMQWRMVRENVEWFGELTEKLYINVLYPLNIAFIGDHLNSTFLSPDEEEAYNWASTNYNVIYLPLSVVESNPILSDIDVIWWHYDESTTLPDDSTTDVVKNTINDFVSNGGGLFLSGFASQYVVDLGLESHDSFLIDSSNSITSTLSGISIKKPQDPIFKDLSSPIYLLDGGLLVNSNYCVLSSAQFDGNWLGDSETPIGLVVCGEYLLGGGKIIFLGTDSYDWYIDGGTNQYRSNIEKLTSNILQNLTSSLNISDWKKY